jgi:hypothetical protein
MSTEDRNAQDPDALPGWSGAGGAIAPDAPPGPEPSDADPAAPEGASQEDRIGAIVAEVRADVDGEDVDRIAEALRVRFDEAGLDVDRDRTAALAAEIDQR